MQNSFRPRDRETRSEKKLFVRHVCVPPGCCGRAAGFPRSVKLSPSCCNSSFVLSVLVSCFVVAGCRGDCMVIT
eukprot:138301-Prymnesium_polylepis.1